MVNGSSPGEGTVLFCYNSTYGTICDDFWDELEAKVVCRQLGYSERGPELLFYISRGSSEFCCAFVGSIPVRSAGFGEGSGSILLDNLMCDGHESSLLECVSSDQIGLHDCEHNEDAGVRCEGK